MSVLLLGEGELYTGRSGHLSDKLTFEQITKRKRAVIWISEGKTILDRGKCKCKGPEACLMRSRNKKEASVAKSK